jgi:mRNA interferase MazF
MPQPEAPSRGEVWLVDLNPVRGREQAGRRPALIVSVDEFNHGPAGLIVALPITSRAKGIPWHVALEPPEGGVRVRSFVKCEDVRSISKERLLERWGSVTAETMAQVEDRLRILLGL